MKERHVMRPADAASRAARRRRSAVPALQAQQFVPGHFLELVKRHNWPPAFVPQLCAEVRHFLPKADHRASGGFDAHALNLPGAVAHLQRAGVR
jgi:hypothetical protein